MKEKKANQSININLLINRSINQKHTISNEYDELFADMQALAFVVSSRRMLLIFWLALFVSSLRCLSGGASLIETLMISVPLSFLIDAAFGCRVGTPWSLLLCFTRLQACSGTVIGLIGLSSVVIGLWPYLIWVLWACICHIQTLGYLLWAFISHFSSVIPYLSGLVLILSLPRIFGRMRKSRVPKRRVFVRHGIVLSDRSAIVWILELDGCWQRTMHLLSMKLNLLYGSFRLRSYRNIPWSESGSCFGPESEFHCLNQTLIP